KWGCQQQGPISSDRLFDSEKARKGNVGHAHPNPRLESVRLIHSKKAWALSLGERTERSPRLLQLPNPIRSRSLWTSIRLFSRPRCIRGWTLNARAELRQSTLPVHLRHLDQPEVRRGGSGGRWTARRGVGLSATTPWLR